MAVAPSAHTALQAVSLEKGAPVMAGVLAALAECTSTWLLGLRRHSAMSNASNTSSLVIRDCIDQPLTRRENRSTTTARYSQPSWVRIWVMSVTQLSLGASG